MSVWDLILAGLVVPKPPRPRYIGHLLFGLLILGIVIATLIWAR